MQLSEILNNNEFVIINQLFKKANLSKDILNNVTIFIPSNQALEPLKEYLSLLNEDEIKFLILSHIIPKKERIENLIGNKISSIGNIINITFENNNYYSDGKIVLQKNIDFNGGYLNIVNGIGFDPRIEKKEINEELINKNIINETNAKIINKDILITEGNPLIGEKNTIRYLPKIPKNYVLIGISGTILALIAIIIYQKKSKRNI